MPDPGRWVSHEKKPGFGLKYQIENYISESNPFRGVFYYGTGVDYILKIYCGCQILTRGTVTNKARPKIRVAKV